MTRGTLFFMYRHEDDPESITSGDLGVIYSTEFNGDMYLDGHGASILERLTRLYRDCKDKQEKFTPKMFKEYVVEFNSQNHKYEESDLTYEDHGSHYRSATLMGKPRGRIIMNKSKDEPGNAPGDLLFPFSSSDYTYWLNGTQEDMVFTDSNGRTVIISPGEMAVFYYGSRCVKKYME